MRARAAGTPALLLVAALVLLVRSGDLACSSSVAAAPDAGDAGVPNHPDAGNDASGTSVDGWDAYNDYDPSCGFYVPHDTAHMPKTISWQACPSLPSTQGLACREMTLEWNDGPYAPQKISAPVAYRTGAGAVELLFGRLASDGIYRVIVDADGSVHNAFLEVPSGCTLGSPSLNAGKFSYRVYDSEATGKESDYGGGAIGGDIDDPHPKTLFHYHDHYVHDFVAGAPGIVELTHDYQINLNAWTDGTLLKTIWSSAQDNGLLQNWIFFQGDVLYWSADSDAFNKQRVYTSVGGVKDFITFGSDATHGAADLGTDGVDMAWIEGSRAGSSGLFTSASIVTSKFTSDPAALEHRVLRSDLIGSPFGTSPFVVGCGYAARYATFAREGGYVEGTFVVRLADGAGWFLDDTPPVAFGFRHPLAVTCDELFALVGEPGSSSGSRLNIARVRLDSLGPGMPPN